MTQKRTTHAHTPRQGSQAGESGARCGLGSKVALITALTTTALAGCSPRFLNNPFTDNRPKQVVEGERHTPIYNVVDQQKIARAQGAPPATPILPVAPIPSAMATPMVQTKADNFDYYAAAAPQQAAAAPNQALGNLNPAPMKVEGSPQRVRKPLQENQYAANNASVPQPSAAPRVPATYQTTPAVASLQSQPVVAHDAVETSKPQESPSFFTRLFGSSDSASSSPSASPPPWKSREEGVTLSEQNDPSPPLSSVPQAPAEFTDIKASREQEVNSLQQEHARAQQQKFNLGGEPSQQQQDVTPVEMPAPPPQPARMEQPVPQSSAPVAAPADSPRAPRRGIDIMTQDEWEAYQRSRVAARQSQPVDSPAVTPVPEPQPQATPLPEQPASLPEAEQPAANPNGYNNLIMTPPPRQRSTPVPTSSLPKDGPTVAEAAPGSRSHDALKSAMMAALSPAAGSQPAADSQIAPSSQAMEVAEKRPSFFGRFFSVSSQAPEPESHEADAAFLPVGAVAKQKELAAAQPESAASSGWLNSLVSDAKASLPAPEPVEAVAGTQVLAHVSDKTSMTLVTPVQLPTPATEAVKEKVADASNVADVPLSSPALKKPAFFGRHINEPEPVATHSKAAPVDSVEAAKAESASAAQSKPVAAEQEAPATKSAPEEKTAQDQPIRRSYFSRLLGMDSKPIDAQENSPLTAEHAASIAPSAQGEPKADAAAETAPPAAPSAADILQLNEGETLASRQPRRIAKAGKPLPESKDPQVIKRLSGYHGLPEADAAAAQKGAEPPASTAQAEGLKPAETEQSAPVVPSASAATQSTPPDAVDTSTEPLKRASLFSRLLGRFEEHEDDAAITRESPAAEMPAAVVQSAPTAAVEAKTEEKPASAAESVPVPPPAASVVVPGVQPAAQAGPPAPYVPFSERPSLLSRIFSRDGAKDEKPADPQIDAQPQPESPAAAAQEMQAKPADAAPAETAATAPVPQPVALAQPPAAPVAQATPAPVQPVVTPGGTVSKAQAEATAAAAAAAAATSPSALPSPRLLDQVKTLPVSRYNARARAHKQKPD